MELLTSSVLSALALFVLGLCSWIFSAAFLDRNNKPMNSDALSKAIKMELLRESLSLALKPVHIHCIRVVFFWNSTYKTTYEIPYTTENLNKVLYIDKDNVCFYGSDPSDILAETIAYSVEEVETESFKVQTPTIEIKCNWSAMDKVHRLILVFGTTKFAQLFPDGTVEIKQAY